MKRPYLFIAPLLADITLMHVIPAACQDNQGVKWQDALRDGRIITHSDLERILDEHPKYLSDPEKNKDKRAILRGINLFGALLSEADLSGVDLSEADLRGAKLFGTDLRKANLQHAEFRETDLNDALYDIFDLRWIKIAPELQENFKKAGSRDIVRLVYL